MLQLASQWFAGFILVVAVAHIGLFLWLMLQQRLQTRRLASYLSDLVRTLSRRSDQDPADSIEEKIDSFIADIRDAIENPNTNGTDLLYTRLVYKDETRTYLKGVAFEKWYSVCRSVIEIYPLLGIVGTVLAIWAGLSAADSAGVTAIDGVVRNFGHSIRTTALGLGAAIVFMVWNAWLEPSFERLLEYRATVRSVVSVAKTRLGILTAHTGEPL